MMLTVTPTISAVKTHVALNSKSCCQKKPCKKEMPSGCDKEKCILNLNLNLGQYIASKVKFEFLRNSFEIQKKQIICLHKKLTSSYYYVIWQPPEQTS